jgi:histone H2B
MPPPTKGGKRLPVASGGAGGKGKGKGKGKKAVPKKSGSTVAEKKRPKKRSPSWALFIHRALKQVFKNVSLTKRSMQVMCSFVEDMFNRLQGEAVNIAKINKVRTLTAREIQTSARLLLPPELAKHAMSEGTKAVAKYNSGLAKDDHI